MMPRRSSVPAVVVGRSTDRYRRAMDTHPAAMAVSLARKYADRAYDRAKHRAGTTARISPMDGRAGALGSRGSCELVQWWWWSQSLGGVVVRIIISAVSP